MGDGCDDWFSPCTPRMRRHPRPLQGFLVPDREDKHVLCSTQPARASASIPHERNAAEPNLASAAREACRGGARRQDLPVLDVLLVDLRVVLLVLDQAEDLQHLRQHSRRLKKSHPEPRGRCGGEGTRSMPLPACSRICLTFSRAHFVSSAAVPTRALPSGPLPVPAPDTAAQQPARDSEG